MIPGVKSGSNDQDGRPAGARGTAMRVSAAVVAPGVPSMRKLPVGSHIVFYRVDQAGRIGVVRIRRERPDVAGRLPDDQSRQ
jgi:plasmid stabilization system protein ParE